MTATEPPEVTAAREDWEAARRATEAREQEWRRVPVVFIDRKNAALLAVLDAEKHQEAAYKQYAALRGPVNTGEMFE